MALHRNLENLLLSLIQKEPFRLYCAYDFCILLSSDAHALEVEWAREMGLVQYLLTGISGPPWVLIRESGNIIACLFDVIKLAPREQELLPHYE